MAGQVLIMVASRCFCCGQPLSPGGSRAWAIVLFMICWYVPIYTNLKFWSQIDLNRSTTTNYCGTILDSCECFINYSYHLCQVVFLDRRNLLAGGVSEERQTYQVQGNTRRRLFFLRNLEKGSIWSRSSFHFLH